MSLINKSIQERHKAILNILDKDKKVLPTGKTIMADIKRNATHSDDFSVGFT